jgi:hypothetical protein
MPDESHAAGRPSAIEHVIAIGITALILEQHSRLPEANFVVVSVAFLTTLALAVAYTRRCIRKLKTPDGFAARPRWSLFQWAILPACLALMLTSASTHWPAKIRFHFSKPSFEALLAQAQGGQRPQGFPRRVGLYWIENVHYSPFTRESGPGYLGFVTGVALVDECGIYYDPSNRPSTHFLTTRIAPCWYITEW